MKRKYLIQAQVKPCDPTVVGRKNIYETTELDHPVFVCNLCGWKVMEITTWGDAERQFTHTMPLIPLMDGYRYSTSVDLEGNVTMIPVVFKGASGWKFDDD